MFKGQPCDNSGQFLPDGAPPPPWEDPPDNSFAPYETQASFELADLLFRRDQMSATNINDLLQIWASTLPEDDNPPLTSTNSMKSTIDSTEVSKVPWESFSITYNGPVEPGPDVAPWKTKAFDVWYRDPRQILHNQLGNRDFDGEIDVSPKRVFDCNNKRHYMYFMSGNWGWRQAVRDDHSPTSTN